MEEKMKLLLDKINFKEEMYKYFENAKLSKIIVSPKKSSWTIFIDSDNYLPVDAVKELYKYYSLFFSYRKDK